MTGTVLPFSYSTQLELIVDPAQFTHPELFFTAARLDRSIALATADYLRLGAPSIERIAASAPSPDPDGPDRPRPFEPDDEEPHHA